MGEGVFALLSGQIMSNNVQKQVSHFFTSVKIWWIIIFSAGLIALFTFSLAFLVKHHKDLWEISSSILAFLGVMLTAGAAIPAISAVFSYIGFTENHKKAEEKLNQLETRLNAYFSQFENIEKIINEKEKEQRFISFLKQPTNKELSQWVLEQIKQTQPTFYLTRLANAAKSLYLYHQNLDEYHPKDKFPALEHRLDLITHYRRLALIDNYFAARYISHLTEILNEFIRTLADQLEDEDKKDHQNYIYDLVLELIRFDEMPESKEYIIDEDIQNTILDLYQNNFLNSDKFRNDVKNCISYNQKQQKISMLLEIKKPLFHKHNTLRN